MLVSPPRLDSLSAPQIGQAMETGAHTVILSPHPDDAVFSAWHAFDRSPEVITVYSGIPGQGTLSKLDHLHGAADSADWMRRRREDDQRAVLAAGGRVRQLDLLDVQYKAHCLPDLGAALDRDPARFIELVAGEPRLEPDLEALLSALAPHVSPTTVLYAPAAIGGHPDHRAVSQAAAALIPRCAEVRYYADTPYFLRAGEPSVLSGVDNPEADSRIAAALAHLPIEPSPCRNIVRLSPRQFENKLGVATLYTTEQEVLAESSAYPRFNSALLEWEMYWIARRPR